MEVLIDCIDERTEIVIVPDGTAVVTDDVQLSDVTEKKYGTGLYILGDLEIGGGKRPKGDAGGAADPDTRVINTGNYVR